MKTPDDLPVVLCVDDDPLVLKSLERLFKGEPVRLLTTLQPRLALKWVEEHDVSLLVTDQRMPEMCGTELVEEVLKVSPRTACVILTAYAMDTAVLPAFLQGVYGLMSKPWDGPMFKSTVRQMLRDREAEVEER